MYFNGVLMKCYLCKKNLYWIRSAIYQCNNLSCNVDPHFGSSTYVELDNINGNISYYSFVFRYNQKIYRVWSNNKHNKSGLNQYNAVNVSFKEKEVINIDKFFPLQEKNDFVEKFDELFEKLRLLSVFS